MLAIRPTCEHCNKSLPYNSNEAVICTFECTYCISCATQLFKDICPNCGGNFSPRPIRPEHLLEKYPASKKSVYKPKDVAAHLKKHNL